jgi:hypothetical protein
LNEDVLDTKLNQEYQDWINVTNTKEMLENVVLIVLYFSAVYLIKQVEMDECIE